MKNYNTLPEIEYLKLKQYLGDNGSKIKELYALKKTEEDKEKYEEFHEYFQMFYHVKNLPIEAIASLSPDTQEVLKEFKALSSEIDHEEEFKKEILVNVHGHDNKSKIDEYFRNQKEINELMNKTIAMEKYPEQTEDLKKQIESNRKLHIELSKINIQIQDDLEKKGLVLKGTEFIAKEKLEEVLHSDNLEKLKNSVNSGELKENTFYNQKGQVVGFVNQHTNFEDFKFNKNLIVLVDQKKFMLKFLDYLFTEELPESFQNYLKLSKLQNTLEDDCKSNFPNINFKEVLFDIDKQLNVYGYNNDTIENISKKYSLPKNKVEAFIEYKKQFEKDFIDEEDFYRNLNTLIQNKSFDYKTFIKNGDYEDCVLNVTDKDGKTTVQYNNGKAFELENLYPTYNQSSLFDSSKECQTNFNYDNLNKYTNDLKSMMNSANQYSGFGDIFKEYQTAIRNNDDEKAAKLGFQLMQQMNPNDTFIKDFEQFSHEETGKLGAIHREYASEQGQYDRQLKEAAKQVSVLPMDVMNPINWILPFSLIKNNLKILGQQIRIAFATSELKHEYRKKIGEKHFQDFKQFLSNYIKQSPEKKETLLKFLEILKKDKKISIDPQNFVELLEKNELNPKHLREFMKGIYDKKLYQSNVLGAPKIYEMLETGDFSAFKEDIKEDFKKSYIGSYVEEATKINDEINNITSNHNDSLLTSHEDILNKTEIELKQTKSKINDLDKIYKENLEKDIKDEDLLKELKILEEKQKKLQEALEILIKCNPIELKKEFTKKTKEELEQVQEVVEEKDDNKKEQVQTQKPKDEFMREMMEIGKKGIGR